MWAKEPLKFYPKSSHFLQHIACLPSCDPKKSPYRIVNRWQIIIGNMKLLSNSDFLICLSLPNIWLNVYLRGFEGDEMKDHGVRRISSSSLHFISPSVFIFLPLKWSELFMCFGVACRMWFPLLGPLSRTTPQRLWTLRSLVSSIDDAHIYNSMDRKKGWVQITDYLEHIRWCGISPASTRLDPHSEGGI